MGTNLRAAAIQVLEALVRVNASPHLQDLHHAFDEEITALHQALAEPEHYAAQNPLGGPAKVFDAMADAIRSGDDYHATLRRYGFAEVKALAEPEQIGNARCPRCWEPITAPTPRKPLTDEALHQVIRAGNYDSMEQFARAVEAAHGITGETK